MNEAQDKWTPLLAMAKKRRQVLLIRLGHQAQADGYTPLAVAQILGVPVIYLHHLYAGLRDVIHCTQRFIDAVSQYLGLPTIVVRCASGFIRLEDFFTCQELTDAAERVQKQPELIDTLVGQPELVQVFVGMLSGLDIPDRLALRSTMCDGPRWIFT